MRSYFFIIGLATLLAMGPLGCLSCRSTPAQSAFGNCNNCSEPPPPGRLTPAPLPIGPPPGSQPLPPTTPEPTPTWRPATDPSARLLQPDGPGIVPGAANRPTEAASGTPGTTAEPPLFDVDVPNFALVKPKTATGHKPFADGLTWLREKGYQTVLHVRLPGQDDAAARRQFESRGFRYLSLEVSPQTLTREVVTSFNQMVTDSNNLPIYVYDRDSSLTGGLWFLHLRLVDGLPVDQAIAEVRRLGFDPDSEVSGQRAMWLAVQKFLQSNRS